MKKNEEKREMRKLENQTKSDEVEKNAKTIKK